MNPAESHCAEIREVLPELALGIADGKQRAHALEHLGGCVECRRELEQLSAITDDLIALAPRLEPPAGFESRVLNQLNVQRTPKRPVRWGLRRLSFVAAVVGAAAATAIVMSVSYSSDRQLASQYRAALQSAHGRYFQSARLHAPNGQQAGTVFGYQGSPSWLFYVLSGRYANGLYREQIVTRSGETVTLPPFRLVAASWGIATPIPVRDIARVRLMREPRGPTLDAPLPVVER